MTTTINTMDAREMLMDDIFSRFENASSELEKEMDDNGKISRSVRLKAIVEAIKQADYNMEKLLSIPYPTIEELNILEIWEKQLEVLYARLEAL